MPIGIKLRNIFDDTQSRNASSSLIYLIIHARKLLMVFLVFFCVNILLSRVGLTLFITKGRARIDQKDQRPLKKGFFLKNNYLLFVPCLEFLRWCCSYKLPTEKSCKWWFFLIFSYSSIIWQILMLQYQSKK